MSGKTYEIISTDAEGRMILADAMTYARQLGCSPLIDVATLTGAMVIALGHEYTGAFSNDQPTVDRLLAAARQAGEKVWQMPADDAYKSLIEGDVADLKNTGGRPGGAITGALFIGAFAEDTPWVHLDIAGAWMAAKKARTRPSSAPASWCARWRPWPKTWQQGNGGAMKVHTFTYGPFQTNTYLVEDNSNSVALLIDPPLTPSRSMMSSPLAGCTYP